jgi:hypothetical protein
MVAYTVRRRADVETIRPPTDRDPARRQGAGAVPQGSAATRGGLPVDSHAALVQTGVRKELVVPRSTTANSKSWTHGIGCFQRDGARLCEESEILTARQFLDRLASEDS